MAREPWYAAPERCAANGARMHTGTSNCWCGGCFDESLATLERSVDDA